jgi:phosphoribosylamine--glycine ligase
VLVEERLHGREVSAMAFTDGRTVAHMPFSCDHKPAFDNDHGPNTGGMGAYSPPGWLPEEVGAHIRQDITERTVAAMAEEGRPYRGVLYALRCAVKTPSNQNNDSAPLKWCNCKDRPTTNESTPRP